VKGPNPQGEICYNSIDDDCDGKVDETEICNVQFTCKNGVRDLNEDDVDCGGACKKQCESPGLPYGMVLLAGGIILLIFVFAFSIIRGRAQSS
jgi:hypothetical protein